MTLLKWLTAIVVTFIIVEGAILISVLINPDFELDARNALTEVVDAWAGSDAEPGIMSAYRTAGADVVQTWIVPLWRAPQPDQTLAAFSGCLACHTDYSEKRRFGSVYFDHPTHETAGAECDVCHTVTAHPNPPSPTMESCAACHSEVRTPGQCQLCHAPGTLTHFERMGVQNDNHENCTVCHLPGSLERYRDDEPGPHALFNGHDPSDCVDCHAPDSCASCHESEHGFDWLETHGPAVFADGMVTCLSCHEITTCGACHDDLALLPIPPVIPEG